MHQLHSVKLREAISDEEDRYRIGEWKTYDPDFVGINGAKLADQIQFYINKEPVWTVKWTDIYAAGTGAILEVGRTEK